MVLHPFGDTPIEIWVPRSETFETVWFDTILTRQHILKRGRSSQASASASGARGQGGPLHLQSWCVYQACYDYDLEGSNLHPGNPVATRQEWLLAGRLSKLLLRPRRAIS